MQHLFKGLVSLDLQFENSRFAKRTDSEHHLSTLISVARPTLRRLCWDMSPTYIPEGGAHTLNFLCEPGVDDLERPEAWTFPVLEELKLKHAIVVTPSLTRFLSAQTALRTACFHDVYLCTPGSLWEEVASALPGSLESWHVKDCGADPKDPNGPFTAYMINKFHPYRDDSKLSAASGWRAKDPFDESDTDPRVWINSEGSDWRMRARVPGAWPLTWQKRNETLNQNRLNCLETAVYVRA